MQLASGRGRILSVGHGSTPWRAIHGQTLNLEKPVLKSHSGLYPKYPEKKPFEDSFEEATFEPLGN